MVIDFYHSDLFLFELLQRKVSLNRIFSLDYNLVNDEEKVKKNLAIIFRRVFYQK